MGMDGVEIVMDVEDHFGISIQDSEAEQVRTVADLVALVHRRIAVAQDAYCPALTAFLSLRKVTRAACGNASLCVRPRDAVTAILNHRQRRELWHRLSELLGRPPRHLRRPRSLRRLLVGVSLGVIVLALGSALAVDLHIWPLTLLLAGVVIGCLNYATLPFRWVPPDGWSTFGDITRKIVGVTAATRLTHLRTEDEILNELRPLLASILGVDDAAIVPSARFVEDLGMD